jgi:hypothetical protein
MDVCSRFAAYGHVTNCKSVAHPATIAAAPWVYRIAKPVFFSTVYQFDREPKGLLRRFLDCVTHLNNKNAAFCEELKIALGLSLISSWSRPGAEYKCNVTLEPPLDSLLQAVRHPSFKAESFLDLQPGVCSRILPELDKMPMQVKPGLASHTYKLRVQIARTLGANFRERLIVREGAGWLDAAVSKGGCGELSKILHAGPLRGSATGTAYVMSIEPCFCQILELGSQISQPVVLLALRNNDNFSPLDPWGYCYGRAPGKQQYEGRCTGCNSISHDARLLLSLLDNPFVLGVYMQQTPPISHEKLFLIPLGVTRAFAEMLGSCALLNADNPQPGATFAATVGSTKRLLYVNQSPTMPVREHIFKAVQPAFPGLRNEYGIVNYAVNYAANYVNYVAKLRSSAFMISPPGLGEDCYRTSEVLLSGAIPVLSFGFATKYVSSLPHLRISNWSALSPALLEETMGCLLHNVSSYNYSIFTKDYWVEHVRNVAGRRLKRQSDRQNKVDYNKLSQTHANFRCGLLLEPSAKTPHYQHCSGKGGRWLRQYCVGRGVGTTEQHTAGRCSQQPLLGACPGPALHGSP